MELTIPKEDYDWLQKKKKQKEHNRERAKERGKERREELQEFASEDFQAYLAERQRIKQDLGSNYTPSIGRRIQRSNLSGRR